MLHSFTNTHETIMQHKELTVSCRGELKHQETGGDHSEDQCGFHVVVLCLGHSTGELVLLCRLCMIPDSCWIFIEREETTPAVGLVRSVGLTLRVILIPLVERDSLHYLSFWPISEYLHCRNAIIQRHHQKKRYNHQLYGC